MVGVVIVRRRPNHDLRSQLADHTYDDLAILVAVAKTAVRQPQVSANRQPQHFRGGLGFLNSQLGSSKAAHLPAREIDNACAPALPSG